MSDSNNENITSQSNGLIDFLKRHWLVTSLLVVVFLSFICWPVVVTWWASRIVESKTEGATPAQFAEFTNLHQSLGVIFTGLAMGFTLLMWVNASKQLALQEKSRKEEILNKTLSDNLKTLDRTRHKVFYTNKAITNPEAKSRIELEGMRLLTEAGHCLDELMYNLTQAESNGVQATFANVEKFTMVFISQMEIAFQLFAASKPWTCAYMNSMDKFQSHKERYPDDITLIAAFEQEMLSTLNRLEQILIGAYYVAQNREKNIPSPIDNILWEQSSDFVKTTMTRLFKTLDVSGDGYPERLHIIADISGLKFDALQTDFSAYKYKE